MVAIRALHITRIRAERLLELSVQGFSTPLNRLNMSIRQEAVEDYKGFYVPRRLCCTNRVKGGPPLTSGGDGVMALASVEGTICGDAGDLLVDQSKQAFDEASRLPECHAEQHLHGQTGLDGGVTVVGLSATFAGRRGLPDHGGIKPDRQRAAAPERFVIGRPVPGLVGGGAVCSCRPATTLHSQ